MNGVLLSQDIRSTFGSNAPTKFTVKTRRCEDPCVETPVSAEREVLAARRTDGGFDFYTLGSERRLYRFRRDADGWKQQDLGFRADSLTAVAQKDGSDKVFFGEVGAATQLVSVYELARRGEDFERRPVGRLATSDSRVRGISSLCGSQDSSGGNLLMTCLRAQPQTLQSNIVLIFGKGVGTGALSDSQPVAATKIEICGNEPGRIRWPHLTFITLFDGELRAEWGSRQGAILQTRRVELPELRGVVDFASVRGSEGDHLFAVDEQHRLHHLPQVGGADGEPPVWASEWELLDTVIEGRDPSFVRVRAHRGRNGGLEVFVGDLRDRLYRIQEDDGAWSMPEDLDIQAATWTTAISEDGHSEVFAVSRTDRIVHVRIEGDRWTREEVPWRAKASKRRRVVYRSLLKVFSGSVAAEAVPLRLSASEHLSAVVNGTRRALSPDHQTAATTDDLGQVEVVFETLPEANVPSINFEAEFLSDGALAVCPSRNVQLYVKKMQGRSRHDSSVPDIYLIPEETEVWQP